MAMKFNVGDRVSSSFTRFEGARMVTAESYGSVVRVERGMPVVRFDDGTERTVSRSNCSPITPDLVRMLAARPEDSLNATQVEILRNNRMLI